MPDTTAVELAQRDGVTISRTLSGAFAGADAQIFTLTWSYDTGDGFIESPWYVVMPAAAESLVLPSLPPQESSGFTIDNERVRLERVVTVSDDGLDGYEAFKDRTAFVDLARGLPSQYVEQLPFLPDSTTRLDIQSAIDLGPRGTTGTVRISGAAPYLPL